MKTKLSQIIHILATARDQLEDLFDNHEMWDIEVAPYNGGVKVEGLLRTRLVGAELLLARIPSLTDVIGPYAGSYPNTCGVSHEFKEHSLQLDEAHPLSLDRGCTRVRLVLWEVKLEDLRKEFEACKLTVVENLGCLRVTGNGFYNNSKGSLRQVA